MTRTIESKATRNNYYYIEQNNNILTVGACPILSDNICGYEFAKCTYNIKDIKKAKSTFLRYLRKYN